MADIILNVFQKSGIFFHSELSLSLSLSLFNFPPIEYTKTQLMENSETISGYDMDSLPLLD